MTGKCLQTFTHMGSAAAFTVAPKGGTQSQPGRAPDGGCHPPGEGTRYSSSMLEVLAVHRPPISLIRNRLNALRITARLLPLITVADVAVSPLALSTWAAPSGVAWKGPSVASGVQRALFCSLSLDWAAASVPVRTWASSPRRSGAWAVPACLRRVFVRWRWVLRIESGRHGDE